jgi:TolB protein
MTVDGTTGSSGDLRADGKRIALSHGMGTITTMNHDGGDPADLSAGDSPRWSPDGEWIVFTRAADVFVMRSDGTEQQRLTDNDVVDVGPDWSPDGTRIVFAQGTRVGGSPTDDMDLYVINRDGTGLTRLTDLIGLVVDPAWSPDGTQIAFASNFPYDWDIYLINSDGTDLRQLTDDPHYNRNPVWSPDGSKIAFFSSIGEPVNDWVNGTYIVNRDGSNRVHWEVLGPVAMLTSWISN